MSLTLASIAVSLVAQITPVTPPAGAATPVSITASVGYGKTWDDEGGIGAGPAAGAGVEWRFRPKWSVGAEVERLGHQRKTTALDWSGRTVFASANLAYRFAARGATPYVGGGFGAAFHSGEIVSRFVSPPLTSHVSSTSTVGYGSFGVELPLSDRFAVSPDFRLTFCRPPDDSTPWATMRIAVKASMRF